jgi:hypothetical protein
MSEKGEFKDVRRRFDAQTGKLTVPVEPGRQILITNPDQKGGGNQNFYILGCKALHSAPKDIVDDSCAPLLA